MFTSRGNDASNKLKAESLARHSDMLNTPVPRLVTRLAVPTVFAQLITVIYNTADTYFVAKISTSAAAAVGVVFSIMSVIQAFGFGIGMGANSIISRKLGAKRDVQAYVCASSALFSAMCFGVLLFIVGELALEPLLRVIGATDTILVYAKDYAHYILLGAPLMCGAFVLNNILRSEGETSFAMWGICTGGILNAFLDPLFIFTFDMGISGAALATVISQSTGFFILLSFFLRGKSIVRISFRYVSAKPGIYWMIFSTGLPTICRQGLGSVSSALLNVLASSYGDAAVAAMTIANKVYMLVRHVVIGIGQGMQPVAGYNYGARNFLRVKKTFVFSCVAGTLFCTLAGVVIAPFAPDIMRFFRPDEDVVAIGRLALVFCCLVMPLMAYSTYVNQLYQCLGFRAGATFLASCRQGIFFFPCACLVPFFGIVALAAMQPIADLLTFLISVPFQIRFFRHHLAYGENGRK